uniref:Uncharacterized protein n=1 Tax=viral metagenome TaxID=1070528 RepID=A0A6C0J568_9ZZZZ
MRRTNKKKKPKRYKEPIIPSQTHHAVHWTVKNVSSSIILDIWIPYSSHTSYSSIGLTSIGSSYSHKYNRSFDGYSVPIIKWTKKENIFYLWSINQVYSADFYHRFDGKKEQSLHKILSILKQLPKSDEIPVLPIRDLPSYLPNHTKVIV